MSGIRFEGDEAKVLHILQTLQFGLQSNCDPFSKADLMRSKINEIRSAITSNMISEVSGCKLLDKYLTQYSEIIDSAHPSLGVNNYAEVSLSLAEHKKCETSKWISAVTLDSLKNLPSVKKLIKASKEKKMDIEKGLPQMFDEEIRIKKLHFPVISENASTWNMREKGNQTFNQKQTLSPQVKNKAENNPGLGVKRKLHTTEIMETSEPVTSGSGFRTARDQLAITEALTRKNGSGNSRSVNLKYGLSKKSAGRQASTTSKFVSPLPHDEDKDKGKSKEDDERLCNLDPDMIQKIKNEIMDCGSTVTWDDIAGLEFAKKTILEIVVWPMLRPDIFHGLRGPPKGILLFGPPGTGKTLIGKCIACQSKATFFSISASSLTSKWIGEGEKMVRTLFAVARCCQPAVIFIDEIDSLLTQRSDSEHESSRRLKTEFLVQFDGAATSQEDRILVIGATNRPQELDEAARRRLVKRLYVPLPEPEARKQIIINLLKEQKHNLSETDLINICKNTDGYSGSDMSNLCREAALGPLRSISPAKMAFITPDQVRPIELHDFDDALHQVKASVSEHDLEIYSNWNKKFGSTFRSNT